MTTTTAKPSDFAAELHGLLPQIRERRAEIEAARQLPADLVEQLGAIGIFQLGIPNVFGGEEVSPLDLMSVIETVAAADGSTGWCTMLGIGGGITAGYMPEAAAREVFTHPNMPKALVAEPAGAAIRTDAGVRVNGRWRFASGVAHADWLVIGCMVMEDGKPRMTPRGPEIIHVVVPVRETEIHDTWNVSGLCGTGSYDVSCTDVIVPEHRIFSLFDPTGFRPEPLYQMPVLSQVAPAISVVGLGIARAALDELCELAGSKVPSMSQSTLAEKPAAQIEIARAEAALGAARSFLYASVDDTWQVVLSGGQPTLRQRALCRAAAAHATEVAARVARTASTLAGGTSVYTASSLQRHARDADVITHHFSQSVPVWEDAGRALLGLQPTAPLF